MTRDEFREIATQAYRVLEDEPDPRLFASWLHGKLVGLGVTCSPRTVRYWITGEVRPSEPAIGAVRVLQADAALKVEGVLDTLMGGTA